MILVERLLMLAFMAAGGAAFLYILWNRRLGHVLPKVGEIRIVHPVGGLLSGIVEVLTQWRVLSNRPAVGFAHLFVFYGFVSFGLKSIAHVLSGFGVHLPLPGWYDRLLDFFAVAVLTAIVGLAIRRYLVDRERLTHMGESAAVLSLIAGLMVTHLLEHVIPYAVTGGVLEAGAAARTNWWVHYLILIGFPALIAHGKHLHLMIAPLNVVLRHMTEEPKDRAVFGADFSMDLEDESALETEYARVGMPNGVGDFSFHALFDTAACIECGRCNDVCPSKDAGLKPRDHFVLALRDPSTDAQGLAELAPPDVVATCTQCRACDTVCPVGNRPAMAGLEMRGRYAFEGLYPPRPLKEGGASTITSSGNIFGEPPTTREKFIRENEFPIFDSTEHEVLFILGCQGSNSPEVQPVVKATAKLLNAAGVKWGVLEEEQCWGEGILQSSSLMEEWPTYWQSRIEFLDQALGGKRDTTILVICPHCRDTIQVQYAKVGAEFPNVVMHVNFLDRLVREGHIQISSKEETMAAHHPCKVIHNDETGTMDELLGKAGVSTKTAQKSPTIPRCCGGGGGGFLWDSPAPVNRNRFAALRETGEKKIVTGCPGCHRMLSVAKDEETELADVATVLAERLEQ